MFTSGEGPGVSQDLSGSQGPAFFLLRDFYRASSMVFGEKKKMHWAACQGQWPGQEAIRLMTPRTLSSACWVIVFKGSRYLAPSLQPRWLLPQISTNRTSQASQFPCYSVGGAGGAGAEASFSSGMRGWRACRVAPSPQHPAPYPGGGSPFPFSCYKPTPTPPAPPVPRPPR